MKLFTPVYFLIAILSISLISHGGFDAALSAIISEDLFFSSLTVFTLCIFGILALQLKGAASTGKKLAFGVLWEVGMYAFGIFISVVIAKVLHEWSFDDIWIPLVIIFLAMCMAFLASSNFENSFKFVDEYVDSKTTEGVSKKIASWVLALGMLAVILFHVYMPSLYEAFFG